MPTYEYVCPQAGKQVEVIHGINEKMETWGELCELADRPLEGIPASAPVKKVIHAPSLAFPKTRSELKNMGFTKLVRRDKGVYENVTAGEGETRYMKSDDPSTFPNLKKKVGD